LDRLKADRFSILQKIKDIADSKDLSITLSMVFSYGCDNFATLDRNISQLLELVSSRGGDQVALKKGNERVEYIGGNSEKTSQRSKVRVHIMENTIQDLVKESDKVFVLGHVNSDYDSMGAALAASSWAQALGKKDRTYIVLKDVPADRQLKETMEIYQSQIGTHHRFITEAQAMEIFDPNADAVFMVDHSDPRISSGKNLLENSSRTIVIDHHRRSESSVAKPLLCYIESTASSTCELMTELLQSSTQAVPIYEAEATIMYLGILVDTNRFKTHTSERTFQAAGTLRGWGANSEQAEKALQLDYDEFRHKNALMEQAELYKDGILIDAIEEPLTRTDMSKISDALLNFKGCKAAFTVAVNKETGNAAVSARSDGSFNVQKIMEKMNGGGHFAAAALEREGAAVKDIVSELKQVLDEEVKG
jgi:c-di-AMP phosphodiesterase-like protein